MTGVVVEFDGQAFARQARGGISRYFVELMAGLQTEAIGVRPTKSWRFARSRHAIDAGLAVPPPWPLPSRRLVVEALNWGRGSGPKPDVLHHTYYTPRYLRRLPSGVARAVTVYDMVPEVFPHLFPGGNPHQAKREYVEAADLVIAISSATKQDLVRLYGCAPERVHVVHLGVGRDFSPSAPRRRWLPQTYVLFVGNRSGYKDFEVLSAAAAAALPREVSLLLVGGGPLSDAEVAQLRRQGLADRTRHVELSDEELASAYTHALAFVFPSRYEGFGLPTLEAMASGCPVILAAASSHPEVGGDAALYFEPGDAAGLAQQLADLTADADARRQLAADGLARAENFTWLRTAQETAALYRQITDDAGLR